ncbi:MAG TPA: aldehyde dehydrogenase family protein, partial [Candidatus Acidoferrales bacterium]|nr:aldehyde dehydrogenase family protein [Candidatus Acidoferrales bacterium]
MATIQSSIEAPVQSQPSFSLPQFKNEPVVDFTRPENARKMRDAVETIRVQLGREYDVVIGGQRVKTGKTLKSLNPSNPAQVVGVFQSCGQDQVEQAMQAAQKAFVSWSRTPVEQRAELLLKVAKTIRQNRFEWDA